LGGYVGAEALDRCLYPRLFDVMKHLMVGVLENHELFLGRAQQCIGQQAIAGGHHMVVAGTDDENRLSDLGQFLA
jgi:hypothetical protein